ncbi:MAG: hypothetical protein MK198_02545 [Gracilimonas sp.]|uniref:hypothetical protein n=1 Tax=Gracilimonas sp. TaxID=1974203 RepID=UPI0037501530|nr:hypothetical protein [Gracilimonas sp.]
MKQRIFNIGISIFLIFNITVFAQNKQSFEFNGQLSVFGSYSPDNTLDFFTGGRYLPELSYNIPISSFKSIDILTSANMYGSVYYQLFDSARTDADIKPYRVWARYTGNQSEVRAGLQKINFGSASLLRPMQWFNQIDPRDPLQITNGVYGVLGRYYFLNNANIWLWALYGNEETRGFDAVPTYGKTPEFGGRIQYPMKSGEMAFSYHHRTADTEDLRAITQYDKIQENRFGLDGKWDVVLGFWFEASFIHKSLDVGDLTNQTLLMVGADYTFGIKNGLTVVGEHLISSYDEDPFEMANTSNISALSFSYPLGLWDNLGVFTYYDWAADNLTFSLNYEHQFNKVVGHLIAFYNPDTQTGIQQNNLINNFSGPGIRLMVVYNH